MQEFKLKQLFNWEKASQKIVKKYVANLYQSGTDAPVATELYNDTGVSFSYERNTTGWYIMIASKEIFTGDQKVQVAFSNERVYPDAYATAVVFPPTNDLVFIFTDDGGSASDDVLGGGFPAGAQTTIEVTFYN